MKEYSSQCISRVYITPGLQLYQVQNHEFQRDEVQSDKFKNDEDIEIKLINRT